MGKKFNKLEQKIERTERREHPNYSSERVQYIAKAAAGNVYREKKHHCNMCGVLH